MFDNFASNSDKQIKDPVNTEENLSRKRLAPLTPAITLIDQRIKTLEEKGRRRGRRNSWIGILSSFLILIIVFIAGYFLLTEINKLADKVDVDENAIINSESDPDNLCPENDSCCLTSLTRLKKNGFMTIDELGVCPEGFIANKLKCVTSLSWCEPISFDSGDEESAEIEKTNLDTNAWKSYKNQEYGFYFSLPFDLYALPEEIVGGMDIKRIYVKKTATSSDLYLSLKIINPSGSTTTEAYVSEQKKVLESMASTSGMVSEFTSKEYRTSNLSGKKIRVITEYQGVQTISEEVIFAGNGFIFAIAYPVLSSSTASSSQTNLADITKAMITTFSIANLSKGKSAKTPAEQSVEAETNASQNEAIIADDDGDGLNNNDEEKYHTDFQKADTDGDGFSDGDEVKNGYNPNGEGML
jgi:hypothetical protein